MVRTTATLLTFVLLLAACGDENGPTAPPGPDAIEIPTWAKVAPEQIAEAKKHGVPVAFENDLGMRFVLIPAGTFLMGSPEPNDEEHRGAACLDYERPQHEVTITQPYYIGMTEATNGTYRRKEPTYRSMSYEGHGLNGDDQPAADIPWQEAVAFAAWLTTTDGSRSYRLPTEAEWEHAARARTATPCWWGTCEPHGSIYANANDPESKRMFDFTWEGWSKDDGFRVTAAIGSYPSNPWGLHDVLGNVWEWCSDMMGTYPDHPVADPLGGDEEVCHGTHALRGGSWYDAPSVVRCACRVQATDQPRWGTIGFRLVSPLPEPGTVGGDPVGR